MPEIINMLQCTQCGTWYGPDMCIHDELVFESDFCGTCREAVSKCTPKLHTRGAIVDQEV